MFLGDTEAAITHRTVPRQKNAKCGFLTRHLASDARAIGKQRHVVPQLIKREAIRDDGW